MNSPHSHSKHAIFIDPISQKSYFPTRYFYILQYTCSRMMARENPKHDTGLRVLSSSAQILSSRKSLSLGVFLSSIKMALRLACIASQRRPPSTAASSCFPMRIRSIQHGNKFIGPAMTPIFIRGPVAHFRTSPVAFKKGIGILKRRIFFFLSFLV